MRHRFVSPYPGALYMYMTNFSVEPPWLGGTKVRWRHLIAPVPGHCILVTCMIQFDHEGCRLCICI